MYIILNKQIGSKNSIALFSEPQMNFIGVLKLKAEKIESKIN